MASGIGTSLEKVAELIRLQLKGSNQIVMGENRVGEVVKFVADTSKAQRTFGYKPSVRIEEGIKKTVEWYGKCNA